MDLCDELLSDEEILSELERCEENVDALAGYLADWYAEPGFLHFGHKQAFIIP